ncbi:AAA domain-containing protein [Hungatella effluvii]|uniref:AAA domain-containing protein n=1 Tax=Hungatella effluvii TaxID=1096246 RepID=A0A2V3XW91_9FIRM|nr:AAA domain-containing protein [Hungatella effluvii]
MSKAQHTKKQGAAQEASPAKAKRKLTRAEKKQITALIQKAKGDGKAHTAQQTIPYLQMYPDGICKVSEKKYSKCLEYDDINYQLAQADDKTAIFENWCDFLNYFDASVSVQLSFINQGTQHDKAQKAIDIAPQDDAFNSIRTEYADMLKNQLAKGNNGLEKHKYITFSIEADNLNAAKARLARIETDILNNFKVLGVSARPMTGYDRLQTLHGVFHPEGEPFTFDWAWLAPSGLTTKDFIAPSSFRFGEGRTFRMGRKVGAVSFLQILAPELNDRMLADILDLETGVIVNLHIKSIDQTEAIKTIKRKITDLDKMKIEEQKKAVRSGYDMDIIPSDLATFGAEAKNLLQDLQSRNERMFLLTFLVVNMADTKQKLENDVFAAAGIAQKYNCALTRLDYQQEAGLMSSVPIGENLIPIQRGLTTSSTAIFIPFITQELFQQGEALYYGLNALSNNMILCDRKQLKNPNGLILGTPGSGKSFAAKREMTNAFLITDDDIIICDPEAEYYPLVQRLHGQVIRISPTSTQYVNPMDINLNYSEDDNPLALKSDFILSLCELVIGGKEGLQPVEKTVIDRAVRNVYRLFLADPDPAKMPILGDLYDELLKQPEPEAARIAAALELYVSGSLNVFNHRTNVELENRLVCFDIKQLGKQLKKLGMLIVQDQTWNRVTINRAEKKATRYYMDEFHLLLKEEQTAAYSVEIWKRFRKWGGIPTAITQNVKDLLSSREVENIFENSDFVLMLNQAAGDRAILAKQLSISPQQMKYVTHTEAGEGLIFFGNVVLPFVDRFPTNTELYRVMTTKPEETGV